MAEAHSATLFVIDVGATMGEERNYNGKTVPKLTRAMEYVNFKLQNMVRCCFRTAWLRTEASNRLTEGSKLLWLALPCLARARPRIYSLIAKRVRRRPCFMICKKVLMSSDVRTDGYEWIREYIDVLPSDLKMVDKLKRVRATENQTDSGSSDTFLSQCLTCMISPLCAPLRHGHSQYSAKQEQEEEEHHLDY